MINNIYIQANWDADVDSIKQKRVRFDNIVIRDNKCEVIACLISSQPFYSLPIFVECLILQKTTMLRVDLGLRNVVLEGDAQVIFKAMQQEYQDWSLYMRVIEDIKSVMHNQQSCSIFFVHREGNSIAHSLPKLGLHCGKKNLNRGIALYHQ